ncbi:phage major capsid protein [Faecalimonas sp.]
MSVESFKPTLWEGALIANFHSLSIADVLATPPSEIKGHKVTFNRVAAGTIKDYAGTVEWEDIDTTPVDMVFDKEKYFAFALDDVDKVQTKGDVMAATTKEHSAVLSETYDKDFFAALLAGTTMKIGSSSAKKKVTSVNAYDFIVDLGTMLSKKKVPKVNRFVTVNADYLGLLGKDKRFTDNPKVLENGIVEGQVINGMQVMCSEELPANVILASHKSAIGAAKQIEEMEAMRLQNKFADGIRGLCVYGHKVLRDDASAALYYEVGTAADVDPINVKITNDTKSPVNTKEVPA